MLWFIDFDDTLAVGPFTWAFEHVIPQVVREHNLPYDEAQFNRAALEAQRRVDDSVDDDSMIEGFFKAVGWPSMLKDQFLDAIFNGYRPALFDDTQAFLDQLVRTSQAVYLLTNNNRAPAVAKLLGIGHYFAAMLTPEACGGLPGKPHRALWDYAATRFSLNDSGEVHIVGDDPWSDGEFADTCHMTCWLVDRLNRYKEVCARRSYRWVQSLSEVTRFLRTL